jgi:DNA polymerase-3 subunit delta'
MAEDKPQPEPDRIDGFPHPRETRDLFGQETAETEFLDSWRSGRLHHAWLLRGPAGIGKATLAYRVAHALLATPPAGDGLFGEAEPATPQTLDVPADSVIAARIGAEAEPRLFVLKRTPNPNTGRMRTQIAVDDVRRLRQFLGLSAADGGWRAVIIDAADEMNRASANALLKFLEEPPPDCIFLLISHAPAGLLPTIRSRCRTLDLAPLASDNLFWALEAAGTETSRDDVGPLAELAGGSVGRSLKLLEEDGLEIYAGMVRLLGSGGRVDRSGLVELAESCAGRDSANRYALVLDLVQVMLARAARTAARGEIPAEAAPGEADLLAVIAAHPAHATLWAETHARTAATVRHAVAVNLDPAQTILDTFLEIDATLGRIGAAAA